VLDITPTAALRMAEHDEKAARDVDDLQVVLIRFLQDRQSAVFRREADHARQGRDLPELDRVEVFERVEVDDHAMLALGDLFGLTSSIKARSRRHAGTPSAGGEILDRLSISGQRLRSRAILKDHPIDADLTRQIFQLMYPEILKSDIVASIQFVVYDARNENAARRRKALDAHRNINSIAV
jgi:hypothetical protein